ncbi:MAG: hypothetical protein WCH04_10160 [Gammaproteobacteria bacterium]
MAFEKEPGGYEKTVLSDLQGAWQNLRDEVVAEAGFPNWERVLFHIDEAMGWESVRNHQTMHNRLVLVRNLLGQDDVPEVVNDYFQSVNELMADALQALKTGGIS